MDVQNTLSADDRPRARGGILIREVDDGFLLYDTENGKVHSLNPTAAYIWDQLDGSHSLAEIAEGFRSFPGAGEKDLRQDVLQAVETFRKEGLLESPAA